MYFTHLSSLRIKFFRLNLSLNLDLCCVVALLYSTKRIQNKPQKLLSSACIGCVQITSVREREVKKFIRYDGGPIPSGSIYAHFLGFRTTVTK